MSLEFPYTLIAPVTLLILGGVTVTAHTGCTPSERQDAKDVLGAAKPFVDGLCLVANQQLPDEEALQLCKVAGPLIDIARSFLVTARSTTEKQVAMTMTARGAAPCSAALPTRATTGADAGADTKLR